MTHPITGWLGPHPQGPLWLAGGLILFALVAAARPLVRGPSAEPGRHDWTWAGLLAVILLAGRWASLLYRGELNADESQLLAGAHALTHDPVFWRSVNGWTAGPLDFFALWPAGWICDWEGYLPARLTAWALIAASLALLHQCLALLAGRPAARLATLAIATIEALTNAPDFLHYSTELIPVALQAGAFYAATRRWLGGGTGWCVLGGVLLGAVPFGKLQAAPLAALTGLGWLVAEFVLRRPDRARSIVALVGGAVLPASLCAMQLTVTREWPAFLTSYWSFNLHYTATTSLSLSQVLRETFAAAVAWDGMLDYWLPAVATALVLMLPFRPRAEYRAGGLLLIAIVATAMALVCVLTPHRPFLHYWQLLMMPLGGLLGASLARLLNGPSAGDSPRRLLAAAAGLTLVGMPLTHRLLVGDRLAAQLAEPATSYRAALPARVRAHAQPGESVAIWGWSNYLYVETGLRQATRDAHVQFMIEPGPLREYFRTRYLADLTHNQPALFLDTIGPASLSLREPEMHHDRNFPELAALVAADYILVEATPEARIYRRKAVRAR